MGCVAIRRPKETKLERLFISPECRAVKDWFPDRASADAAIPAIHAHIKATGETHTCFCHTHTRPPDDAVPIYIGEFTLPLKYLRAKRFCPCPVCWDEFGKFGHGKIAWFAAERVIRLIGDDCFKSLNPEAHEKAQSDYDLEQTRRRNAEFLLSNLPRLLEVIDRIKSGIVVAKAIERFHAELQRKLAITKLNLWQHARHDGVLSVNVNQKEFRRGSNGEMYAHEVSVAQPFARLSGYQMLDPVVGSLSGSLETALKRVTPYDFGTSHAQHVEKMDDAEKQKAADILSRCVRNAMEKIAEIEVLQAFVEPVAINSLRSWGAHEGCPIPRYYSHDGGRISFGKSEHETVAVELPEGIRYRIPRIDFWVERERKH